LTTTIKQSIKEKTQLGFIPLGLVYSY
jgi:hypothetical protein